MLNHDSPPDPVALYRAATDRAIAVVQAVRQDQLKSPTPCTEWTVQQLMDHLVGGTEYLLSAAEHREAAQPADAGAADYRRGVADVLKALEVPGTMEQTCISPLGFEWPVSQAVTGTFMDVLIHTWDLARATGQDEATRTGSWRVYARIQRRTAGIVGPAVEVSDDASAQDRLLAAMGRRS